MRSNIKGMNLEDFYEKVKKVEEVENFNVVKMVFDGTFFI